MTGGANSNNSKSSFLYFQSCSKLRKCCGGVFLYVLANKREQSEADKCSEGRHQVSQVYK
jgi:hypothetical protein